MRQSLAKGQRRELRRAMGIGALSAMKEQDQAIAILSNALTTCQREIAALAINFANFKRDTVTYQSSGWAWVNDRTFLQRVRWLLTGK